MGSTSAGPEAGVASRLGPLRTGPVAAAIVALALLGTACGGGNSHSAVAHLAKRTSSTVGPPVAPAGAPSPNYEKAIQFTECMRKNGEPGFPEPNSQGDFLFKSGSSVDPKSPAFAAAQKACKAFAPPAPSAGQASAFLAQTLKFSKCMRRNGVPNFPDPSERGGTVAMTIGSGMNPDSPQFQKAFQACHSLLPQGAAGGP